MEFTNEQIEKAKNCKTLEEFKSLVNAEGIELSEEELKTYFNATRMEEMSDDDLSSVAGGKGGKWVVIDLIERSPKCPFCGATINFTFKLYEHDQTKKREYKFIPNKCGCGAIIQFDCFTKIFSFLKNGEIRHVR